MHKITNWLRRIGMYRIIAIALLTPVVVAAAIAIRKDSDALLLGIKHIAPRSILLMLICYTIALAMGMLGWTAIISRLSSLKGLAIHFRIYSLANIGRRIPVLPWHVVTRIHMYSELGVPRSSIIIGCWIEQALIFASGVIVYLLSLIWNHQESKVNITWLMLAAALSIVTIHPKSWHIITRLLPGISFTVPRMRDLIMWTMLYVVTWCIGGIAVSAIVSAFTDQTGTVVSVVGAWSLSGAASSLVVVLPYGLGIREISLTFLLLPYMPLPMAAVASVMIRILTTILDLTWGVVFILHETRRVNPHSAP